MLDCFAIIITRLYWFFLYSYINKELHIFLEFQRIKPFQTHCQVVNSQHFCRGSFQLATYSKRKPLNDSILDYFKNTIRIQISTRGYEAWNETHTFVGFKFWCTDCYYV